MAALALPPPQGSRSSSHDARPHSSIPSFKSQQESNKSPFITGSSWLHLKHELCPAGWRRACLSALSLVLHTCTINTINIFIKKGEHLLSQLISGILSGKSVRTSCLFAFPKSPILHHTVNIIIICSRVRFSPQSTGHSASSMLTVLSKSEPFLHVLFLSDLCGPHISIVAGNTIRSHSIKSCSRTSSFSHGTGVHT